MKKKIVVIGAGMSGLSAGIYSLMAGFDVEIYERNTSSGGLCTGWTRKGTYIDGCLHWLTESNKGVLYQLWRDTGALDDTVEVFHYEAYSQACINGKEINLYTNHKRLLEELLRFCKSDRDRKYMTEFVQAIVKCRRNAITVKKPVYMWNIFDTIRFIIKILPIMGVIKRYSKISVAEAAKHIDSEELKFMFTNSLVPEEYSLYSLISTLGGIVNQNSGTPIGGSKAMMERVEKRFRQLGGKLTLRADVQEIVVENDHAKGIRLADGQVIEADYVIAACDLHYTIEKLLHGKYRIPQLDQRDQEKKRNPTYSMMLVSFRTKADLSKVAYNRYVKCPPYSILGQQTDTLYIKHFGYDPTLSTNGYTVVQAVLKTDEVVFDRLEKMSKEEYKAYKQEFGALIEKQIRLVDGDLYGELELLDVATPLTFTHYVNTYKGSFMAYMLTENNKQMILPNDALPIDNLALANHWLMVPGGIPIAVMQGKFAAVTVREKERKRKSVSCAFKTLPNCRF